MTKIYKSDPAKPDILKKVWDLATEQGAAFLVNSAPEGYMVQSIMRKGKKATVIYKKLVS